MIGNIHMCSTWFKKCLKDQSLPGDLAAQRQSSGTTTRNNNCGAGVEHILSLTGIKTMLLKRLVSQWHSQYIPWLKYVDHFSVLVLVH